MAVYQYSEPDQANLDLRTRLLPLICELNALPIRQFHRSWLDSTAECADISELSKYPAALPDLSAYILKRYRLKSIWIHDFENVRYRILLINSQALNRLVFYLGLIIVSPHLRKVIDGNMLRKIGEVIGEEEFEFSRKKAAFYNPGFIGKIIKVDHTKVKPETIYEEIVKKGMMCMGLIFWEEDKPIRNRLAVKLPKPHARVIVSGVFEKAPRDKLESFREAMFKIFLKLIKEIEPSWQTIFV